jgi:hypothetical protein
MYLGIVIVGATHGLILLPVVLTYLGNLREINLFAQSHFWIAGKWTKRKHVKVLGGEDKDENDSDKPLGWSF